MPLSQGRNDDLSESLDGYSTSPWESPKSTTSLDNLSFTHSQCYAEEFSWNSSCESNSIHDSEDKQTLQSDKEDVNNCRDSKFRLFDSVLQNSVNLNSNEINGVTDHESKIMDSILKNSDPLDSIQTNGIKEQELPDVTLDLPYEKLDSNEKISKLSNLMLEYPDHVDSYDLLAMLDKPSYSPGSEGFPDNPEWDDVEGYSVNIEDSIIETMEIEQKIWCGNNGSNESKIKVTTPKKIKLSTESETAVKKNNSSKKHKKNRRSSRKTKKRSSAFQI